MGEKLNLKWQKFPLHAEDLFRKLMETEDFSDITLVSDDQHMYKVHRFILSSCSSVFKNILNNSPLNTTIYLRGIHHEELDSILQFIYLGESTFYQERMGTFLNVAKDLKIKDIGDNSVEGNYEIKTEVIDNFANQDINNFNYSNNKDDSTNTKDIKIKEKGVNDANDPVESKVPDNVSTQAMDSKYSKSKEDSSSSKYAEVNNRSYSVKRFLCGYCDYSTILPFSLKEHERTHTGDKPEICIFCQKGFTHRKTLENHKRTHTGFKPFKCKFCDLTFSQRNSVNCHVKSNHKALIRDSKEKGFILQK